MQQDGRVSLVPMLTTWARTSKGFPLKVSIVNSDFITTFTTETVISGTEVVFLAAGNNRVDLADSDAVSTSRILGVASGTVTQIYTSGSTVDVFTMYGDRLDNFTGLTAGEVQYLDTVPGGLTNTPSPASGRVVVQVGIATSPTQMLLQPDIVVRGLA